MVLEAPIQFAFSTFARTMVAWWPRGLRVGIRPAADIVIEPAPGGRWYERADEGGETDRGRTRYWDPPHRLVLSWQIDSRWAYETRPGRASHVDVMFTADGPQRSIVRVRTQHPAGPADGGDLRALLELWGGWPAILDRYVTTLLAHSRRWQPTRGRSRI